MKILRSSLATRIGPSDWFTGNVLIDAIAEPTVDSRMTGAIVHFAPGARTAWHTHPHGQTLFVTEGVGVCQRREGPVEVLRPGDRVFFEPGEDHWHGATADRFLVHIALVQVDEAGTSATWGDKVTDEEYAQAPTS